MGSVWLEGTKTPFGLWAQEKNELAAGRDDMKTAVGKYMRELQQKTRKLIIQGVSLFSLYLSLSLSLSLSYILFPFV